MATASARSIRCQMTIAKLLLAKDIEPFDFSGTPIHEGLLKDLATGAFVAQQRNVVLIGGAGRARRIWAIAIAPALIRGGTRGRFFNVVDLVNRLETGTRGGKPGRTADCLSRLDFVILHDLGYLPFAQSGGQLVRRGNRPPDVFRIVLTPPDQPPPQAHPCDRHHQPRLRRMARSRRSHVGRWAPGPPPASRKPLRDGTVRKPSRSARCRTWPCRPQGLVRRDGPGGGGFPRSGVPARRAPAQPVARQPVGPSSRRVGRR